MNLTKALKKAPLTYGFYNICGEQGAGKTSFAVGLLRTDYKRWRRYRYNLAVELADEYYIVNGIRLNVSETLYFSSVAVLLDEKREIYTHAIDLAQLGLPNPDYEVQYLPRGSVVFIMEADVLAYCHNWQKLSDYLRNLIKYVRQNDLTIIFDMQIGGALAKALRELVMGIYYMFDSGVKRFFIFWKRQKWKFLYIHNQRLQVVKEFSSYGLDINAQRRMPVFEWGNFSVWGHVFNFYNSFAARPYFLKDIEKVNYVYREHKEGDLSADGINAYCEAHPLINDAEDKNPNLIDITKLTKSQKLALVKKFLAE